MVFWSLGPWSFNCVRIVLETTLLADDDLAVGYVGPAALTLNGQQLVDAAEFFRAAAATFFARGNASITLQFRVQRLFGSIKKAERFALTHPSTIPLEGLLAITAGESGDTVPLYLEGAVLEQVQIVELSGACVVVQYTIKGSAFTSDVPDDLPGSADSAEETIVMRRGKPAVGAAVDTIVVVFSSPLAASPIVKAELHGPTGSAAIGGQVLEDTITIAGFTYKADAATPDASYKLHYIAVE